MERPDIQTTSRLLMSGLLFGILPITKFDLLLLIIAKVNTLSIS